MSHPLLANGNNAGSINWSTSYIWSMVSDSGSKGESIHLSILGMFLQDTLPQNQPGSPATKSQESFMVTVSIGVVALICLDSAIALIPPVHKTLGWKEKVLSSSQWAVKKGSEGSKCLRQAEGNQMSKNKQKKNPGIFLMSEFRNLFFLSLSVKWRFQHIKTVCAWSMSECCVSKASLFSSQTLDSHHFNDVIIAR